MTADELQELIDQGVADAEGYEAEMTAAYSRVLGGVARATARAFRESVTLLAVADEWAAPHRPEDLVDADAAAAAARKRVGPVQEAALSAVVGPSAASLHISFEIMSPLTNALIAQLAARAGSVVEGLGEVVSEVIQDAHAEGLSVAETAKRLLARIGGLRASQALLLARSDLVAIGNGGSMAAAQAARTAGVEVKTKTWLTAGDDRVRPTHVSAEGQTVDFEQPFLVGLGSLQYPGDPSGPAEEVWNCRCTVIFGERKTMRAEAYEAPPIEGDPKSIVTSGHALEAVPIRIEIAAASPQPAAQPIEQSGFIAALETLDTNQVAITGALSALAERLEHEHSGSDEHIAETLEALGEQAHVIEMLIGQLATDASVVVNVPEQPAPVVTVQVPVPEVNVAVETPPRMKEVVIERDGSGRVLGYTIDEFDSDPGQEA